MDLFGMKMRVNISVFQKKINCKTEVVIARIDKNEKATL